MPNFQVTPFEDNLGDGNVNAYVDLIGPEGQMARIGYLGCNIQRLILNYGTNSGPHLISVIFTAEDWHDLKSGKKRGELPRDYTIPERRAAHALRTKYPSLIEATTIDIANRTENGEAVCQDPNTGEIYVRRKWDTNFEPSHALLHGHASENVFKPDLDSITQGDTSASIMFPVLIGTGLDYFSKVVNYVTFSLDKSGLTERGKIVNEGDNYASIAFGRHPSFRIGAEGLDDHNLIMDVKGALATDDVFNPTGNITPLEETIFYSGGKKIELINLSQHHIDTTYLLGTNKNVVLQNKATGYGLSISVGDDKTRMVTVWTNELGDGIEGLNRQHCAIEALVGTHAGMLSLPAKKRFEGMKGPDIIQQIPEELRQFVLAPGQSIKYVRTYKPTRPTK